MMTIYTIQNKIIEAGGITLKENNDTCTHWTSSEINTSSTICWPGFEPDYRGFSVNKNAEARVRPVLQF